MNIKLNKLIYVIYRRPKKEVEIPDEIFTFMENARMEAIMLELNQSFEPLMKKLAKKLQSN